MSSAGRFRRLFSSRTAVLVILVLACLLTLHCDDSDDILNTTGPYSLRFSLAGDYQAPHGGQAISWALIRSDTQAQVAVGSGTVSATANPAYRLTTDRVMEFGVPHEIHYWIDSNIGGGTPGVCDAETVDLQWITRFAGPTEDLEFIVVYKPELVQDVCDTFAGR